MNCSNISNQPLKGGSSILKSVKKFTGVPVSSGSCEGTVKVLRTIKDFDKVQDGDVIVVYASSPAWVVPLSKASALIAEVGGILCHTAIVARELGIPAIVNIKDITKILHDGERITVDGNTGEVNVLG